MRITMITLAALLLVGCANVTTPALGPRESATPQTRMETPSAKPRNEIVPLIDAHQHMMGPAAMSTLTREPSPPPVAVPEALAKLLGARERGRR